MTRTLRLTALAAFATFATAPSLSAQQYRVELSVPGGKIAIAEFLPCTSAADPGCGAWVDRTIQLRGAAPRLVPSLVSPNGHDSVSVEDGRVRIKTLDGRTPPISFLRIGEGIARGVAISADSRYAFVVVANVLGNPADVIMIDLATQNGVVGLVMDARVLGIRMAP